MVKRFFDTIRKKIKSFRDDLLDFKSEKGRLCRRKTVIIATIISLAVFIFCIVSDIGSKAVKVLYVDGEKVGVIDSPDVYRDAKQDAELIISEKYGVAYKFADDSAHLVVSARTRGDVLTKKEITDYLIENSNKSFLRGYGLYIDGVLAAVGYSEDDLNTVLLETINIYKDIYARVKSDSDIIVFTSKTEIKEVRVPDSLIKNRDELRDTLGYSKLLEILKEIENGTVSDEFDIEALYRSVPQYSSISNKDISLALPSENVYFLCGCESQEDHSGNVDATACLSFTSSSVEVVTEIIPCGEEIIYDDQLMKGKKVLQDSGVYGVKEVTYDVTYINGEEKIRNFISEQIVKEPVPKVYRVGTKIEALDDFVYVAPGNTAAGPLGNFILPTSGILTSKFSGRNLFGQIEFHGAVDIANKSGTPVFASDGGTVVYCDWFDSYGKCIIIDHGKGFQTLYAHLSSYSVHVGDVVGQGWQIGAIGMTGRVTGAHLHFEVRINGNKVDPLEYIGNSY